MVQIIYIYLFILFILAYSNYNTIITSNNLLQLSEEYLN